MGLFDMFLSDEKKIKKHHRRLVNRDAQAEDREASAFWLAENGSEQALLALLSRFDMNLEHQLNNKKEKEQVYSLAVQAGASIRKPLQTWLRQCKQIGMPLRLHGELFGEDDTVKLVYELLETERARLDFKAGKKKLLLIWLADIQHAQAIERAVPFLDDFDEGVRYAAAEVIFAQQDDAGRVPLLTRFAHPDEDSNRLKVRMAEVFANRRWSVAEHPEVAEVLTEGYGVRDGRIVAS